MTNGPAAPASSRATWALVLGILAVCMGFVAGVPAAALGRAELTAIEEGRAPEAGRARATIGMALGLVMTVLSCLACGIYVTIVATALAK